MAEISDGQRVIPASEILAKIQKGEPVEYDNIIVEGNLDIGTLNLLKSSEKLLVTSKIKITNSSIDGITRFSKAIIIESINFHGTKFSQCVDFSESQLAGHADFKDAQFSGYGPALFNRCQFSGDALFERSRFNWLAEFVESHFGGNADFKGSHFGVNALFNKARFSGRAIFERSEFCGSAGFYVSLFEGVAEFSDSLFKGNAGFSRSLFNQWALFSRVRFNGGADFDASVFAKVADFDESQFGGDATFRESKFNEHAFFNRSKFSKYAFFFESSFDAIVGFDEAIFSGDAEFSRALFGEYANFESAHFNKRLILDNSKIYNMNLHAKFNEGSTISLKHPELSKLDVSWKNIKDKLAEDISAYSALIRNYNNLERFDEADSCSYQYKIKRSKTLRPIEKIFDFISLVAYGYGVHPEYPLYALAVILFASAILYSFEGQTSSIGISAIVLTTTNQIAGFTETCKCWSIIERILGWLLMSTFIASLGKKLFR